MTIIAAFLALAVSACSGLARETALPTTEGPDAKAAAFAAQAEFCALRRDTAHAAFHGCIDWHSSVHAVWTLTVAHKRLPALAYQAATERDLTPENLQDEFDYVTARPQFELPYGRAWFLRLAVERRLQGLDGRLDPLAASIAQSLMRHYVAEPPNPLSRDYSSAAWAYINLLAYGKAYGDDAAVTFVEQGVRTYFATPEVRCDAAEDETDGFLAPCGALAWLAADVLSKDEYRTWLTTGMPTFAATPPITDPASAHLYGMNFSRAWGFAAAYRKLGEDRYRAAYCSHLQQGYADWQAMKQDYGAVGHWVAQFGMLALEQGRDDRDWCAKP